MLRIAIVPAGMLMVAWPCLAAETQASRPAAVAEPAATQQATPQDAGSGEAVRYSREQSVLIRYRLAGPAPGGVQMWISLDGRCWIPWHWSDEPAEPLAFTPPRQGHVRIALLPAERPLREAPADLRETLSMVFDWDKPLLRLLAASRARSNGEPVVRLAWAAWDENFGPRPISVHWRPDGSSPWQVGVGELANSGAYEWVLPGEPAAGAFELCLRATDAAGNTSEVICPIEPAPSPRTQPAEPAPVATRPAETPPPVVSLESAVPASQVARAGEAQRLCELAGWHASRNDLEAAESLLRKSLEMDPTLVQARIQLGNLLQRRARYQEAAEEYQAALAVKPDDVTAWRNLALAYMALKDYPRARSTLQQQLLVEPDEPQTWLDLGDVEMLAGRPQEARRHWAKAQSMARPYSQIATRAAKRMAVYLKDKPGS